MSRILNQEEILKFMPPGEIYIDQKLGIIKFYITRQRDLSDRETRKEIGKWLKHNGRYDCSRCIEELMNKLLHGEMPDNIT